MKRNFLTVRARVFCGAAAFVAAALAFCAVVFSCDMGGSNDAALALAAMGQGVQSGSAGTGEIKWAGSQTLSGSIAQEGIFPAEFCAAQDVGGVTQGVSKSIFPTVPTTGLTYSVTASATISGAAASATGEVDASVSPPTYKIDLPYATGGTTWSVTVSATSGGKVVLTKTQDVPVNSSASTTKAFKLEYSTDPTDGTGSVSLKISYASTDVSAVNVYWNNSDDADERASDEGWVIYNNSGLASGSYDIKIVFTKEGAAVYAIKEKVNVYANLISNMIVGNADYISSGKINVTSDCISVMGSVADGGIWLGGKEIVDSSVAANDANSGTKFKPVATLYRAFQIANSLAAVDSSKTYTINVQGDVNAGTSANKTASLDASAKVLLKGTNSSAYYTISGGTTAGTYKISSSSSSLTCNYLTFDKLGGFTVAAGKTTANYCKVTNGTSSSATSAAGITIASGATFSSTSSLAITGCTNSVASGCGGGIYCAGTLDLAGTTIKNCKATGTGGCGGGIYVTGTAATVTLDGCSIGVDAATPATASSSSLCSNYAAGKGGGIYIANSSSTGVTLKNSTNVSYNYAANGGGIYLYGGTLSLSKTIVQRNGTASGGKGGGIYLLNAPLTFSDALSTISYNTAAGTSNSACGGGLYISETVASAMSVKGTFNGNSAYLGGGIYNASPANITLTSCTVGASGAGNSAEYGGGVYNSGTKLALNGATIQCNNDATYGGGVYNYDGNILVIYGSTKIQNNKLTATNSTGGGIYNRGKLYVYGAASISDNSVQTKGGGFYTAGGSTVSVKLGYDADSSPKNWTGSISANEASNGGGGYVGGGSFIMNSGTIGGASASLGNKAAWGAGLYFSSTTGTLAINDGTIQYNDSSGEGGGIYVSAGSPTVCATISNNSAATSGGGFYTETDLTIIGATFKANNAPKGSGIYYYGDSGTSLTLGGSFTIGTSASDRLRVYLASGSSAITLSDFSKTSSSGKVEITPNVGGGCVIGTNLISSGVTSSTVFGYFTLPSSMAGTNGVYKLTKDSTAAKLDLESVPQVSITGKTVSTRPYTSSTSTTYVTTGAFANANTESVVVRSIKMATTEVSYELWYAIYQWAIKRPTNPYTFGSYGKEGVDALNDTAPTESVPPTTALVNSGEGRGGQRPVTFVSWRDAVVWCNAYSEFKGLTPVYYTDSTYNTVLRSCNNIKTYTVDTAGSQDCPYIHASTNGNTEMANCDVTGARLPTEAEWEFAARGGNPTVTAWNYTYAGSDAVADVAWYKDGDTLFHCVGKKTENTLGLFDMTGNNSEWCDGWYNKTASPPTRREKGGNMANISSQDNLRVSYSGNSHPARFGERSGFRFVQNN